MNTAPNIITAIRNKLSAIHNTTGTPHKGTLYLGRKEWEEFEIHARREWMMHIKSHQTNWVAGTPIALDPRFAAGIYTKDEVEEELARRKEAAPSCDASAKEGE